MPSFRATNLAKGQPMVSVHQHNNKCQISRRLYEYALQSVKTNKLQNFFLPETRAAALAGFPPKAGQRGEHK